MNNTHESLLKAIRFFEERNIVSYSKGSVIEHLKSFLPKDTTDLDISNIVQVAFLVKNYYPESTIKRQIVLHHTVSSDNAKRVFEVWNMNPERVATAFVIGADGVIHQGFGSKYWAHHLGTKLSNNTKLNKESVGIEVCSWGGLTKGGFTRQGRWISQDPKECYNAYGGWVPQNQVVSYDMEWRGYKYFHKYTPQQIESLRQLILYLCDTYNIPKDYQESMWNYSSDAVGGNKGIFTHVSYRKDKSDMHPQEDLIEMLKNLNNG